MTGAAFLDFAVRSLLIGALSWGVLSGFRLGSRTRGIVLFFAAFALLWTMLGLWLALPGIAWLPAANPAGSAPQPVLFEFLARFWLAGLSLAGLREVFATLRLRRLLQKAEPCLAPVWLETLREAQGRLGWPRPVELRVSADLGPCATGFLRRIVLLPPGSEDWTATTRLTVLLHELAHFQRGDLAWQWIGRGLVATQWFNPFVPLLRRLWENDREAACDALAARLADVEPAHYARTLLSLAADTPATPAMPALAMLPRRQSQLERRIRALVGPAPVPKGFARFGEIAMTVAILILLAACSLSHSPRPPSLEVWTPAEVELRLTASPFPDA